MVSFENDYSETAHPLLLEALVESNLEQCPGYGNDDYCKLAVSRIQGKLKADGVDVHLLVGGTQTNLTAISAFLRPHEAAICANYGHINVHETGAIEATGHKVLSVATTDGKLTPELVDPVVKEHGDEHMVKPRLLYISDSTEIGTIYNKAELTALWAYAKENDLLLYLDGARLGSALCCKENDLTLADLPHLTDAFYIGGTKNGALCGEALCICNDALKADFRYMMKQKGGLMAKGKVLGVQFAKLFEHDLFFDLAHHANHMAWLLRDGIADLGYGFFVDSPSNQIFPVFPDGVLEKLMETYRVTIWGRADAGHTIARLVTSWATPEEQVHAFLSDLEALTR